MYSEAMVRWIGRIMHHFFGHLLCHRCLILNSWAAMPNAWSVPNQHPHLNQGLCRTSVAAFNMIFGIGAGSCQSTVCRSWQDFARSRAQQFSSSQNRAMRIFIVSGTVCKIMFRNLAGQRDRARFPFMCQGSGSFLQDHH